MTVGILVTGGDHLAVGVDVGTRVILLVAVAVQDVFTGVDVVQVHRIDRSDVAAVHERIHVGAGARGSVVEVLVGCVHVQSELQIGGGLDVHGSAAGKTVEGGSPQVTVLIQITHGHVVVAVVGGTAGGNIVFLAYAPADGLVEPVDIVLISFEDVGSGDDFALLEKVGGGFVENVQIEALGDEVLVDIGRSCRGIVTVIVLTVVLETAPGDFHEFIRVGEFILGDTSLIHTGGGAGLYGCAALGTLLGGDEDNTVGSAVTVQGGGSGILQDGHRLDIGRVQVGDTAAERNTVDHIQRAGGTVHGTVTTDHDGRAGTRIAIGAVHLDTGYRAFEGAGDGGGGTVGNLIRTHG